MSSLPYYLPVLAIAVFLNTADIYFLQSDRFPRLLRAPSYWLYMAGHILVGLGAAYLLYQKAGMQVTEWPIVTIVAALTGFSVLQSFTIKFGEKGIDARELFDAWKRRVIEDVSQSNTSRKRARQMEIAHQLAKAEKVKHGQLDAAIRQLASTIQQNADTLIKDFDASGMTAPLLKAQWIASIDLEFAENLART
jgi:hypothetical protein